MRVEIYIPSNKQNGRTIQPIKRDKAMEETQRLFCHLWGGCTTIPGVGNWTDSESRLHVEPVSIVTSYGDCGQLERETILLHCRHLQIDLEQSAIMVVFGDCPEFIESAKVTQ